MGITTCAIRFATVLEVFIAATRRTPRAAVFRRLVAKSSPSGPLNAPQGSRRSSSDYRFLSDISRDHRTGSDNRPATDSYPGQHDRPDTDESVLPDYGFLYNFRSAT